MLNMHTCKYLDFDFLQVIVVTAVMDASKSLRASDLVIFRTVTSITLTEF